MSTLRFALLKEAVSRKASPAPAAGKVSEYFGANVFCHEKMKKYLSKAGCRTLMAAIKAELLGGGYLRYQIDESDGTITLTMLKGDIALITRR